MVMHARKFPRLDDGYYDRNQSHLMEQEKQLNNSRSKHDRYTSKKRDIPDVDGLCGHSPSLQSSPRYGSKTGHGERKSEKDRSSTDRRSEDSRQNSHGYKDVRNKDQKLKDHKAEVHKLAEKVCGDWSEHVSSSGKRYYYNCKTEVSQWELPGQWVQTSVTPSSSRTPRPKDSSEKLSNVSLKGQRDWAKHSSVDKNSTKTTPVSSSPHCFHLGLNSSKPDGLTSDDSQSHATNAVAVVTTNSFNRPRSSSSATPNSKGSSDGVGSAAAGSDGPARTDCRGPDVNFTDRMAWREVGAPVSSSPNHSAGTPVNVSGVYGHVASSGVVATPNDFHRLHRHDPIIDSGHSNVMKSDDMDISPGSTPTEESMLQRHGSAKAPNSSGAVGTPASTPLSAEQPGSVTPSAGLTPTAAAAPSSNAQDKVIVTSSTSLYNQSVLTTLAALQQAVSQLTAEKTPALGPNSVQRPHTSSLLSCLALLPALISQLNTDKFTDSQTRPQERQQNQQITKQAIDMLQKLQQALVAQQQQQQQQRQLQQLLLQLLSVQKSSSLPSTSSSSQWTTPPPSKQIKLDSSNVKDAELESPYSPPDSDGTPLGTPDTRPHLQSTSDQVVSVNNSINATLDAAESVETDAVSTRHPSPLPASAVPSVPPVTLGTSQLAAAAVHRKQDSTDLTPSLANYFNSRLIEHVLGWQVDAIERQADCFAEESHTIGSIHCTQVTVELKRARSLVRASEIQSTLHEQRIMFLHQRYRELEQVQSVFNAAGHVS